MSGKQEHEDEELKPTFNEGYRPGEKKSVTEYAQLDAHDESLSRWKASLGISANAAQAPSTGPKVTIVTLTLTSATLPAGQKISFNLADEAAVAALAKNPITIKEGIEYSVGATFKVNRDVISGLRYIHVVKRAGITVDRLEQMIGSYGPHPKGEVYSSTFPPEESPSGVLARTGTYHVRSRFLDDDAEVYADFQWSFKLGKEW
ncbi:hypothetical protein BS47DRAFT_1425942 [Hydnum rufescens UP504]|uniref:Rho GDP-dissociation inhibitor n=1 Tax=Hydnum rufescens UP504 TaxID=1448309 RepID=A0A9P6DPR4_9AGAM|nr:hypothetical protein BS47DRAFT_1425942 [Hydnum rufescens UP504]